MAAQMDEGTYYATLADMGTDELDNANKTPYIWVKWAITLRAQGGVWVEIDPVTRESRWWMTEKAELYTLDRLQRLGFNGDLEAPEFNGEKDPREGVVIECRHERRSRDGESKTYENWDLPSVKSERTAWKADRLELFRAKYQLRLDAAAPPAGAAPTAPAAPPVPAAPEQPDLNTDIADDEIPF